MDPCSFPTPPKRGGPGWEGAPTLGPRIVRANQADRLLRPTAEGGVERSAFYDYYAPRSPG